MKWADEVRTLGVRTNTDQPDQARVAKAFGAEDLGGGDEDRRLFRGARTRVARRFTAQGLGA